jgi:hypothetical protein
MTKYGGSVRASNPPPGVPHHDMGVIFSMPKP